jgi:hypothetical protein
MDDIDDHTVLRHLKVDFGDLPRGLETEKQGIVAV